MSLVYPDTRHVHDIEAKERIIREWIEAELRRRFNAVASEGRPLSKSEAGNVLREFVAEIEAESERYLEIIQNPLPKVPDLEQ